MSSFAGQSRDRQGPSTSKSSMGELSDVVLKEKGNQFFSAKEYEKAIACYGNAIRKNPSVSAYFSNKALCELRLNRFQDCAADCRAALELDKASVKAHYFLGQALCEMGMLDDGINHMQLAVELGQQQKLSSGDDMTQTIRNWRRRRFEIRDQRRLQQDVELQTYLARLIAEDRDRKIRDERARDAANENPDPAALTENIQEIEQYADKCLSEMNELFTKCHELRKPRELPDYLCGKISFDLLRDPVITPSGITYERKDIERHLMCVGHFDPVTRVPLTAGQLISNYVVKEVVNAFVEENEWALHV